MTRSRTSAVALSVLLHAAIFAAGVFSISFSQPMAMPGQLAIEAIVVDLSAIEALKQAERDAELAAERERLRLREEEQTRLRQADEAAERERQRLEQERIDQQRREEQAAAAQQAEKERAAREAAAAREAQRLADEQAEQDRQAELKRRQEAEQKRLADVERKRKEETERRAREAQARRQAEAEALLVAQLEEEERRMTAARSGLKDQYVLWIQQKITRSWLRPDSAGPGLKCEVSVTQLPSREVVDVRVGKCNGDAATVRSIEAAVYKASPLPAPPDPALFERKLIIIFEPDE